jgi:hypothetical protein
MRAILKAVTLLSALLMAATASAQVQGLERVGPTSTSNGFPTWYQDKSGITLEFCSPLNVLELDGGWCLLLPGDTVAPEVFPTPFSDEHFYWAADAIIPASAGLPGGAKLVLALEGAFAVGPVINGDQITFTRIRFVFDAPQAGTYTIRHPFGTDTATAANAGDRIFVTEDIGITCQGNFECALHGRVGPFLLASNTPGGQELPAVAGPVAGKLYIADPARDGPVTGSPIGQNFFSISGPNGQILAQTNNFTLMGRLQTTAMGGRVNVEKARYALDLGATQGKVDVFASAFATAQPRLPGVTTTPAVTPLLGFYPAACSVGAGGVLGVPAGVAEQPMFRADSRYYGQMFGLIPAAVCVQDHTARDPSGQTVSSFTQATVTDQVTISQALYTPAAGGTLTVTASSSDQNLKPQLTASLGGPLTLNADGTATVVATNIVAPPPMITVTSAKLGHADLEVSTGLGLPVLPNLPFAGNDAFTIAEDSPAITLNVLGNDTISGLPVSPADVTIAITHPPALGTAVVVAGAIQYTPFGNANGTDSLLYTISNAAGTSDQASVVITITNVNDRPVAVDDAFSGVGGIAFSGNLLANDTDPDGAANLAGINIVTAPAGLVYTVVGGVLSFSAPAGTYVFTYQARDLAGALSANTATVTVTLAGGQTLAITRADYTANKRRWRIDGTSSVPATQTVFVMYADGVFADGTSAVGFLVASTQAVNGLFAIDFTLAGANDPRNPTSTAFLVRPTRINAISDLGANSPVATIIVR